MTTLTKTTMMNLLHDKRPGFRQAVIGRALVRIFKFQTESEKVTNHTQNDNGVGFAGCDARQGSIAAKTFIKRNELMDFQIEYWMKPSSTGFPRICKYVGQLNRIINRMQ